MTTIDNFFNKQLKADTSPRCLYGILNTDRYRTYPAKTEDWGDGMSIVSEVIGSYWKPRFLMDNNTKCAYEFMDRDEMLVTVSQNDIDWDSLQSLPQKAIQRARRLSFHYPSFISLFKNGVAEVDWQLNPDGRYYMDDDGFGMTDDKEINIYGFIDKTGTVVVKFQAVDSSEHLYAMRRVAENACDEEQKNKRRIFNLRLRMDLKKLIFAK